MKKYILTLSISFLIFLSASAQVVVKMNMPEQPAEALSANTLFEEILPTNIPIVLGPMGYDIQGGQPPYTFQWLENEALLSESEIATITLTDENAYSVVIHDANNCSVTLPLLTDRAIIIDENALNRKLIQLFYSNIDNQLHIQFLEKPDGQINLSMYDVKGVKLWEKQLEDPSSISFTPASGIYFLTITGNNLYQLEKLIVP